jgi:membrane protease YdiL (CAAX protease family)
MKEDIMMTIKALIKRHPVRIYFVLTFILSWGSLILLSGGPSGFPKTKEQFERMLPLFIPVVLAGPSIASILLTAFVSGKAGFGELLSRLFRWRVDIVWYAVAFLTAPLVLRGELLLLSLFSPRFLPGLFTSGDKASLLVMGATAGLIVGIFEELGWTGFATARLRRRYGVLTTGLIVGVVWGAWHIFLNVVWVSGVYSGGLPPALFLTARGVGDLVGLLPAFRVLMVWVYDRTGSLLVAMLMHASLTASTMILEPPGIPGVSLLVYDVVSAAAMWIVVAAVVVARRGQFSRRGNELEQATMADRAG